MNRESVKEQLNTLEELISLFPEEANKMMKLNIKNTEYENIDNIKKAYKKLRDFHEQNIIVENSKEQGDLLENYILEVLTSSNLFEIITNKRTSGNEIDLILKLNKVGREIRSKGIISNEIPDYILVECKNYSKKVGITYLNKFHSLLSVTNTKLGFFVSYNGVKGKNWQSATGLIKKINLMNYANSALPKIIEINNNDFKSLISNELDIQEWLNDLFFKEKYEIESLKKPHENENEFKKILSK